MLKRFPIEAISKRFPSWHSPAHGQTFQHRPRHYPYPHIGEFSEVAQDRVRIIRGTVVLQFAVPALSHRHKVVGANTE